MSTADNATTVDRRTGLTSLITTVPVVPMYTCYTSPSVAVCGAAPRVCSIFAADCTDTTVLPFRVQSAKSCFAKQSVKSGGVR